MELKLIVSIIFTTLLFSVNGNIIAQAPGWEWAKGIIGTGDVKSYSITHDLNGNVYTTGSFAVQADFDPDSASTYILNTSGSVSNCFILKLDSMGNFVWVKVFENMTSFSGSEGFSIALDATGNIYTIGYFQDSVDFDPGAGTFILDSGGTFLSKLDNNGNFIWTKSISGAGSTVQGLSIALDDSGNVYSTGYFRGTIDFDPDSGKFNLSSAGLSFNSDIFIWKTDSSGNFTWAKSIGGNGDDAGNSITLDENGNIYTTGNFQDTVDFDPGMGTGNLISNGGYDAFVSKYDRMGNFNWTKSFGRLNDDESFSVSVDNTGNVLTTGFFEGSVDFDPGSGIYNLTSSGGENAFISKLNNSGDFVWAKAINGTGNSSGQAIIHDDSGDIYTTGFFEGTADFDPDTGTYNLTSAGHPDIFISRTDNSGNFIWAKAVGGTSYDYGSALSFDPPGNLYSTGYFASPVISFDSTDLINGDHGGNTYNLCIAKIRNKITGIVEVEVENNFNVFPNPANDYFYVGLNRNYKKISLSVTDIYGKMIYNDDLYETRMVEINTINFVSGIYFVKIESDNFVEMKKIIVEK